MYYADALGFLGLPGGPVFVNPNIILDLVHLTSAPPWLTTMAQVEGAQKRFVQEVKAQEPLEIIRHGRHFWEVASQRKIAVVLGLQNAPDDVNVRRLKEIGVDIMAIAYQGANRFGSGWLNAGIGLTLDGEKLITACVDEGMIVDLSHAGHQTAWEVLIFAERRRMANLKIIASHGGCFSQYHHFRNLPDDVLKKIAERSGVVGIATLTFILDERDNSPAPFFRHIEHALSLCGQERVVIGSDSSYITLDVEMARRSHKQLKAKLDPAGSQGVRFPEHPHGLSGPNWLKSLWNRKATWYIASLTPRKQRILSKGVFGNNFINFIQENLIT